MKLTLGCLLGLLLALVSAPSAQAGAVTIAGGVLQYSANAGEADHIQFRRMVNDIEVRSPDLTPLTEDSANCNPPNLGVVLCPGVAVGLSRIRANGLDGNDQFDFSDLGVNIIADADLGPGNDIANVLDQAQPFLMIARGGAGRDLLIGGNLGDTLDGGADTDSIRGLPGPDDIIGGDGFDEVHYDNEPGRTGRVLVSLDDAQNDGNDANNERDNVHSDVEDIFGSEGADVLVGSAASNVIYGYEGNDTITGGAGFDVMFGDGDFGGMSGNDTIFARDGIGERINCGAGTDTVVSDDIDGASECETNDSSPDAVLDRDADGVNKPGDCNDANPAIKPGVFDTPDDGIDQNCDGADATDLDRDRDGFNRPQDCDDNRNAVFPGADEVPGNGRDEDCNGQDAPFPQVRAGISFNTRFAGTRIRFTRLVVTDLQKGDTVRISCSPKRCGVPTHSVRAARAGRLDITRRVRRALPSGSTLDVRVSRPNSTAAVLRLPIRSRRTPTLRRLCLPQGASKPGAC